MNSINTLGTSDTINTLDNTRINKLTELTSPQEVIELHPLSDAAKKTIGNSRHAVHEILTKKQDKLVVVVGPCSIHDVQAALEYCDRLLVEKSKHQNTLEIIMRVYFEKPRTTVGWKGLINDPHLDNTFDIDFGLKQARELLLRINEKGMPSATEFLDMISPQYIGDLISWGAIGARTTESQLHRELASGLSCPVGFKNGTDGNTRIAIDAIMSASQPHHFLSVTKNGKVAIVGTAGNDDCFIILRGGSNSVNYDRYSIEQVSKELTKAALAPRIMIDTSHANSHKVAANQYDVCKDIARQIGDGDKRIMGVMIESHLVEGRQNHTAGQKLSELTYGQSITDGCIGWEKTVEMLQFLSDAVVERRKRIDDDLNS